MEAINSVFHTINAFVSTSLPFWVLHIERITVIVFSALFLWVVPVNKNFLILISKLGVFVTMFGVIFTSLNSYTLYINIPNPTIGILLEGIGYVVILISFIFTNARINRVFFYASKKEPTENLKNISKILDGALNK
jgi:hypothetical protein